MNVLALDNSLRSTGVADLAGTRRITPTITGVDRLAFVRDVVLVMVAANATDELLPLVAMEGYSYGSPNQAHQLGELGGVIRLALHEAGVPFIVVPPASVKTYGCGKGNASKDDMLLAAVRRFDYEGNSKDEADALILWALVKDALGEPVATVPETHRRVVPAVAKLIEAVGLTVAA